MSKFLQTSSDRIQGRYLWLQQNVIFKNQVLVKEDFYFILEMIVLKSLTEIFSSAGNNFSHHKITIAIQVNGIAADKCRILMRDNRMGYIGEGGARLHMHY